MEASYASSEIIQPASESRCGCVLVNIAVVNKCTGETISSSFYDSYHSNVIIGQMHFHYGILSHFGSKLLGFML